MKKHYRRAKTHAFKWQPWLVLRPRSNTTPATLLKTKKSLTKICLRACTKNFEVQPVQQVWAKPYVDEARLLGLPPSQHAFIRQVHLLCAGEVWIFARTIIPRTSLTGRRRRMLQLGSRSLGSFLFSFKSLSRSLSQYLYLEPHQIKSLSGIECRQGVWARRNVYLALGKPILVSEFFIKPVVMLEK